MFKQYFTVLIEAVRATLAAKSRAILSAICIGIGIAGVTLVTALGAAAIAKSTEMMDLIGTDAVIIMSGGQSALTGQNFRLTLSESDMLGLRNNFPDAYLVAPLRSQGNVMSSYGNARVMTEVQAINTSVKDEWNWELAIGRDFVADDQTQGASVCIIGSFINETFFPDNGDPIGAQIRIGRYTCEVIGVTEKKSIGAMDDMMNSFVMVPDSMYTKRFNRWFRDMLIAIRMKFYDPNTIDRQMENVTSFLRMQHNLADDVEDDFLVITPSTMNAIFMTIIGAIGAFLGVITLVIVIVGGFVTANMFLLATQTRIKEIGIRRAFGATGRDIFTQFITEFLVIISLGMLTGLTLGSIGAAFISSLDVLEVKITLPVFSITAIISAVLALTFGILPARSAAKINPIEAIRTL